MVKIYTKTGDAGTTSLLGGRRVEKDDLYVRAYGAVDELNSLIGTIIGESEASRPITPGVKKSLTYENTPGVSVSNVRIKLLRIQSELLFLGSDLSAPLDVKVKIPRVTGAFVKRLEKEIDSWEKDLPKLKNFILPGGSAKGSKLHLSRSVARRAEREINALSKSEEINRQVLIYINRLSDWLFVLARYVNKLENAKETIWKGRK